MPSVKFWVRWSWRDLRKRIPQVLAISAVLGLGAGLYSGLGSTAVWRRGSLNDSLDLLAAHDIRVDLLGGLTTSTSGMRSAIDAADLDPGATVETRLIAYAPLTADDGGTAIPAAGVVVGVDLASMPTIDRWRVTAGRDLTSADAVASVALLDLHFARAHDLPSTGTVRVGDVDVEYVGLALEPEYFNLNTTSGASIQGEATRAVLYTSIQLARTVAGSAPGDDVVNDAVVRLGDDTSPATSSAMAASITAAIAEQLPFSPATVVTRHDDVSTQSMFNEITSEERVFQIFALLVLAGAGFAAFNLTKRVVESQRRDIGIAMSLGVPPRSIIVRTMLLIAQIVLLGVIIGLAAGEGIAAWVLSLMKSMVPLPVWSTPWQWGRSLLAVMLVVLVPFVAAAVPLWRAVRVRPVDALLPPHLRSGRHRLARLARRIRLPGSTTTQAPFRRITRAPARSVVTIIAISFIIAPLLAALGATDSTTASLRAGERSVEGTGGDHLVVALQGFQTDASSSVAAIRATPGASDAAAGLDIGGYLRRGDEELGMSISMVEPSSGAAPASVAPLLHPGGIVISSKAAHDLGVSNGDDVTLVHPQLTGTTFGFSESTVSISIVDDSPYRFVAYMDLADRVDMGLDGVVNSMQVHVQEGTSIVELEQALASVDGVASVLPASSLSRSMRDRLSEIDRLFAILQLVTGALAFLVAFNASNLAAQERSREHATMLAFGMRRGRIIAMSAVESLLLGIVGVAVGLALGNALLAWVLATVFPTAIPDLAVGHSVELSSYLISVGIGLAAVTVAPLFNLRHLRTMNLPGTLRYVE